MIKKATVFFDQSVLRCPDLVRKVIVEALPVHNRIIEYAFQDKDLRDALPWHGTLPINVSMMFDRRPHSRRER